MRWWGHGPALLEMNVDSSGAAAAKRLVMSLKERREGLASADSIPSTETASRAHFSAMLNQGTYASVGLQASLSYSKSCPSQKQLVGGNGIMFYRVYVSAG